MTMLPVVKDVLKVIELLDKLIHLQVIGRNVDTQFLQNTGLRPPLDTFLTTSKLQYKTLGRWIPTGSFKRLCSSESGSGAQRCP